MICNFTDIVLVNVITQSHPHPLDRIIHPQRRKMFAISPMNPSISQISKPHHAMHLQLPQFSLYLQLLAIIGPLTSLMEKIQLLD